MGGPAGLEARPTGLQLATGDKDWRRTEKGKQISSTFCPLCKKTRVLGASTCFGVENREQHLSWGGGFDVWYVTLTVPTKGKQNCLLVTCIIVVYVVPHPQNFILLTVTASYLQRIKSRILEPRNPTLIRPPSC